MPKKWLQNIAPMYARPRQVCRSRGFTLAEMLVSIGITSTLVLALGSILMVATHALPEADLLEGGLFTAHQVAEDMATELQFAITFTEREPNAITFTVADRDSDSTPELIRYAWSGVSGTPLTRQYNSDAPVEVLVDVNDFALTYHARAETGQSSPSPLESGETLLAGYDTPGTLLNYDITDFQWIGQTIEPSLPANATAWSVTRVQFCARAGGNTAGVTAVQLRPATPALLPNTTVLSESPMYENTLGGVYVWQEFSFLDVSGLDPAQDLCLVLVSQISDNVLAQIQYEGTGGSGRVITANQGSSWTRDASRSMLYRVYGTVTTATPGDPNSLTRLHGVGLELDLGMNSIETRVQILNAPEVRSP